MSNYDLSPEETGSRGAFGRPGLLERQARRLEHLPGGLLLAEALRGWWIFLLAMVVAVCGAIMFLSSSPKVYTASIRIEPSTQTGRQNGVSTSGLLGGLTALSGAGGSTAVTPYTRFLNQLDSHTVAERLQRNHHVLQQIFAGQWDEQSQSWRVPTGTTASVAGALKALLGYPQRQPGPTMDDLVGFIQTHLSISSSESSSIRQIEFRYNDQAFAKTFLSELITETDAAIRDQVQTDATAYMGYLGGAVQTTTTSEVRQALTELIVEQQRQIMMISAHQLYAADIIDGPYVSSKPTSPVPALALALSILLGICVSIAIVLFRAFRRASARHRD